MKINKILVMLGIAAFSATTMAQPQGPRPDNHDRVQLNPQPLPPRVSDHDRVQLNPQPLPPGPDERWDRRHDRDFRTDRDYRRWNDRDHRRNYEFHRSRINELRVGMRKREVLALPWWQHPLYIRDNGPFDTYVYADGRHGRCVLNFQFNRLAEIHCD